MSSTLSMLRFLNKGSVWARYLLNVITRIALFCNCKLWLRTIVDLRLISRGAPIFIVAVRKSDLKKLQWLKVYTFSKKTEWYCNMATRFIYLAIAIRFYSRFFFISVDNCSQTQCRRSVSDAGLTLRRHYVSYKRLWGWVSPPRIVPIPLDNFIEAHPDRRLQKVCVFFVLIVWTVFLCIGVHLVCVIQFLTRVCVFIFHSFHACNGLSVAYWGKYICHIFSSLIIS